MCVQRDRDLNQEVHPRETPRCKELVWVLGVAKQNGSQQRRRAWERQGGSRHARDFEHREANRKEIRA